MSYDKFQALLDERNIKTAQVAKETGIDKSTFANWKSGRYTPKADKVQKIADYFGVPISYFYGEKQIDKTYYVDDETREILQCYFEKSGLRMLMQAARDLEPEQIEKVTDMIKVFKGEED